MNDTAIKFLNSRADYLDEQAGYCDRNYEAFCGDAAKAKLEAEKYHHQSSQLRAAAAQLSAPSDAENAT